MLDVALIRIHATTALEEGFMSKSDADFSDLWDKFHKEHQEDLEAFEELL